MYQGIRGEDTIVDCTPSYKNIFPRHGWFDLSTIQIKLFPIKDSSLQSKMILL